MNGLLLELRSAELAAAFIEGSRSTPRDRDVALDQFHDAVADMKTHQLTEKNVMSKWEYLVDSNAFEVVIDNLRAQPHVKFQFHIKFLEILEAILSIPIDWKARPDITKFLKTSGVARSILDQNFFMGRHLRDTRNAGENKHKSAKDIEELKIAPYCGWLTLRSLGSFFRMYPRDKELWSSFERDDLLFFVLTLLLSSTRNKQFGPNADFGPHEISDSFRILAQDPMPVLDPCSAGPKVVGLVSLETAWERSIEVYQDPLGDDPFDVDGFTVLVIRLLDDPGLQEAYWTRSPNGYEVIVQVYWNWMKSDRAREEAKMRCWTCLAWIIIKTKKPMQTDIIQYLVRKCDLVLLLGKCLILGEQTPNEFSKDLLLVLKSIASAIFARREVLIPLVIQSFKHIEHGIIVLQRCKPIAPEWLSAWQGFGKSMGIPESGLIEAGPPSVSNNGCAWYKCSLHGEQLDAMRRREMLLCGKCHVQYCSLACQKRDWKEGRHKGMCSGTGSAGAPRTELALSPPRSSPSNWSLTRRR